MNAPTIRLATEDDVEHVLRMQQDLEREGIGYGFVASSRDDIAARLGPYFFVAEADGSLAGYTYGSVLVSEGLAVTPAGQRYLDIQELYVVPERRRQGLGGRLLQSLLKRAAADGIERVHVFSSTKDQDAILRFYRRHGFSPWGVQLFR